MGLPDSGMPAAPAPAPALAPPGTSERAVATALAAPGLGPPDVRTVARRWWAEGVPAVVVSVLATRGSAPREAGTRLLVSAQAAVGTIGGGHLELQAIADARALLAGQDRPTTRHVPLGPALGQCCGGAMTLGLALLSAELLAGWPDEPLMGHLQLHGAGHVGRAVAQALAALPMAVTWVDGREDGFAACPWPPEAMPRVRRVLSEVPEDEVWDAPAGSCFLVMTHRHDLDLRLAQAVLRRDAQRQDVAWFGLIGSATKRARFEHRLQAQGVTAEHLARRLVCPVGAAGFGGAWAKQPEVLALGVVAQLVAAVQGRPLQGRPADWPQAPSVHAVAGPSAG